MISRKLAAAALAVITGTLLVLTAVVPAHAAGHQPPPPCTQHTYFLTHEPSLYLGGADSTNGVAVITSVIDFCAIDPATHNGVTYYEYQKQGGLNSGYCVTIDISDGSTYWTTCDTFPASQQWHFYGNGNALTNYYGLSFDLGGNAGVYSPYESGDSVFIGFNPGDGSDWDGT